MAVSYLGLTESQFWNESPRRLLVMIDEWKKVQRALQGIPEPGTETEGRPPTPQEEMWAAWDSM